MSPFQPEEVATLLEAAGVASEDWDLASLAEVLDGQWAEAETVRRSLHQSDEPALEFDPRWE